MMESSARNLWKVFRLLGSFWGPTGLDCVCVRVYRIDGWTRLDVESQNIGRTLVKWCPLRQKHYCDFTEHVKVTLLFQTEIESQPCLTACSGHGGKLMTTIRQVLIHFPVTSIMWKKSSQVLIDVYQQTTRQTSDGSFYFHTSLLFSPELVQRIKKDAGPNFRFDD